MNNPQRVVCAANRNSKGLIICGARHWDDIMCTVVDALSVSDLDWEQGFIDNYGKFLTREEASVIAVEQDQLKGYYKDCPTGYLFSEHLY